MFFFPWHLVFLVAVVWGFVLIFRRATRFGQRLNMRNPERACGESDDHGKAIQDNRISKTNRLWRRVCFVLWLLMAGWNYLRMLWWWSARGKPEDFVFWAILALVGGGIVTFYLVGIPLRVAPNLIVKERRRPRLGETVMCVIAFLVMTWVFYLGLFKYPPESMGY